MAINFSNVNIDIRQFQEVASGDHNAGEVKLVSETEIDKVNNHVHWRGLNKKSFSLAEVIAVKNAFVNALSNSGVGREELNRICQELGLAPRSPVDTDMRERNVKPLSRQQVREILDRCADTINQHVAAGTIRKSEQIYARVGQETRTTRINERNVANAELATRRSVFVNKQISLVQSVLAGDVDFYAYAQRQEYLNMAKSCLDRILEHCGGNPSENKASVVLSSPMAATSLCFPPVCPKGISSASSRNSSCGFRCLPLLPTGSWTSAANSRRSAPCKRARNGPATLRTTRTARSRRVSSQS